MGYPTSRMWGIPLFIHTPNSPSTELACTFARNQEIDFTSAINKKMRMVESLSDRLKLQCWSLWKCAVANYQMKVETLMFVGKEIDLLPTFQRT